MRYGYMIDFNILKVYPSVSKCQISVSCSSHPIRITKIETEYILIFSRHQVIQNFHPLVMFVLNYSCLSSFSRLIMHSGHLHFIQGYPKVKGDRQLITLYGHWSCWFLSSIKQECAALIIM